MTEEDASIIGRQIASCLATAVLVFAAIDAFGLLRGFGVWAAIWLLSPYAPRKNK